MQKTYTTPCETVEESPLMTFQQLEHLHIILFISYKSDEDFRKINGILHRYFF